MKIFVLALLWSLFSFPQLFDEASCAHHVFFKGTQHPLVVYILEGQEPGPTILVQGGIQGDEPSGFMTAEILTQAKVKKGRLVIIPRANIPSVHLRQRQINVDMNRRFDQDYGKFYEDILARAVRFLLRDCDGVIHLHEGSGFYSPTYVSNEKHPKRYGQSVIIDTESYQNLRLGEMCRRVLADFNPSVEPQKYAFSLLNTRTIENTSPYLEQRKSLTYYVLTHLRVPALAIEVSKSIFDLNWKVKQQLALTLAFLREMGVEVECDIAGALDDWFQKEFVLRVNEDIVGERVVLTTGKELKVALEAKGSRAVYAVFASDRPGYNLLESPRYLLRPFKSLDVYADGKKIRSIPVDWKQPVDACEGKDGDFVYKVNGKTFFCSPGSQVELREGDRVVFEGVVAGGENEILNVKGYVAHPPGVYNSGQDIGAEVILTKGMFLTRYIKEDDDGWVFRTVRETPGKKRTSVNFFVRSSTVPAFVLTKKGKTLIIYGPRKGQIDLPAGEYVFEGAWPASAGNLYCLLNGQLIEKGEKISLFEKKPFRFERIETSSFFSVSDLSLLVFSEK